MGEVVALWSDPVDPADAQWVRAVCFFAGAPERADGYLDRGTPREWIVAELRCLMFGRRSPENEAGYMKSLRGTRDPARRPRPIHPGAHGTRRRPAPWPDLRHDPFPGRDD